MYGDFDRSGFGRTPVLWLIFLAFLAVALATFPVARILGGGASGAAIPAVYLAAVTVALIAVIRAARSGEARGFWVLVGCGVVLRFIGNLGWVSVGFFGFPTTSFAVHDGAYALSYAALLGALFVLVSGTVPGLSRITALIFLDAACVMLSVGLLVWYFALGGNLAGVLENERSTLMFVLKPAADAALLSVALILYAGPRRPVFVPYLATALAAFLFADALHLTNPYVELQALGGWPEALRAVGFVLLCLGALRSAGEREMKGPGEGLEAGRGALSFWFGPLSPALHCGVLLGWGALQGFLPPGLLAGSAVVVGYVALRSGITARANRRLRRERERLAAIEERARISEELHDTLKQELHAVPLLLELHRGDGEHPDSEYLEQAITLSKIARERMRLSVEELRTEPGKPSCAQAEILETISELAPFLPFRVHEDLDGSLSTLSEEEVRVARQTVREALWNAAKHAGAKNMRITSRLDGKIPTLTIRDDGCGFDAERTQPGFGLGLMRRRAQKVGARLRIKTEPGAGTEVRLAFEGR